MNESDRIGFVELLHQYVPHPVRHRYCMKHWRPVVWLFLVLDLMLLAAFAGSIAFIGGIPGALAALAFLAAFGWFNYWLIVAVEVDDWLRKEYRERVLT